MSDCKFSFEDHTVEVSFFSGDDCTSDRYYIKLDGKEIGYLNYVLSQSDVENFVKKFI